MAIEVRTLAASATRGSPAKPFPHAATALAAAMLFAASGVDAAPPQRSSEGPWAKGRVLVMPKPALDDAEVARFARGQGGKASRIAANGLHVIELPVQASETAVLARLKSNPHLEFAELDRYVPPSLVANDPYMGSAWHLSRIGAPTAWDGSQGGGITIAILDTGVNPTHADLAANLVPGWNVFNNNSNTSDFMGHGTATAGAAAAITNNGKGVAGVAGQSRIMPLVVTDSTGGSFYSVIAQAITYAADKGARVASISFSGLPYSSAIQSAATYMRGKGGLVIVAAGNTGAVDNVTPTATMIPVAATNSSDVRTSWSTYGAFVALSAPGDGIYSTSNSGGYGIYNGTSFSTPIVAGTAALMMAANPALGAADVENLLFKTAVDLGAAGRDVYYGHGRVNAAAAVQAALTATPTANDPGDTTAPKATISAPLGSSTVSGLVPVNVSASDNVGVTKVELRVNGALLATDTSSPFAFSWDSTKVANGSASLVATAYDAAGNKASSATVTVNVANATTVNAADTTPPTVAIVSPTLSTLTGNSVTVSTSASDNAGAAGITQSLYIDGKLVKTVTGGALSYNWNIRKVKAGTHTLQVAARDAAGNTSSATRQVVR